MERCTGPRYIFIYCTRTLQISCRSNSAADKVAHGSSSFNWFEWRYCIVWLIRDYVFDLNSYSCADWCKNKELPWVNLLLQVFPLQLKEQKKQEYIYFCMHSRNYSQYKYEGNCSSLNVTRWQRQRYASVLPCCFVYRLYNTFTNSLYILMKTFNVSFESWGHLRKPIKMKIWLFPWEITPVMCVSKKCRICRNLQSGVLLPFLCGRPLEKSAWYITFTCHLPIVQNLDFCLISQKTKHLSEPCTNWSRNISGLQCYHIRFMNFVSSWQ